MTRTRMLVLAGVALLAVSAIAGVIVLRSHNAPRHVPLSELNTWGIECGKQPEPDRGPCMNSAVTDLALEDWQAGPLAAREADILVEQTAFAKVNCHATLHSLGSQLYAKFGDAILSEAPAGCTGGFIHGALQGGASLEVATKLCKSITDDADYASCSHGVGHGNWLANKDVVKAVAACAKVQEEACLEGVFMEISDQGGRKAELMDVCADNLDGPVVKYCYAGLLSDLAMLYPHEAQAWCTAHPDLKPDSCWYYVGRGVGQVAGAAAAGQRVETVIGYCGRSMPCLDGAAQTLGDYWKFAEDSRGVCTAAKQASNGADWPGSYCSRH